MTSSAKPVQYALVAYVRGPLGLFVEELRRDLLPEHSHLAAHITILPPRFLQGTELDALVELAECAKDTIPYQATLGEVETFAPVTPTVFLNVEKNAEIFHELHDRFNSAAVESAEQWPYRPHLTIVKMPGFPQAEQALEASRTRWDAYQGNRQLTVSELTFVREGNNQHWIDIASIPLRTR